ncbi:trypsin-like [Ischnura elegans]|uniref:trypsin-like n=1 Tax=Ischnura elegans TaxID=197161 RepID=UPI001ED892CD|nr:trypsin-like [Ischnura elegans]
MLSKRVKGVFFIVGFYLVLNTHTLSIDNVGPPHHLQTKGAGRTDPKPYIEGGDIVEGREFPWLASLRVRDYHFCGANILNSDWVLSMASCMLYDWDSYSVQVGSNTLDAGGTIHDVTKVVMHEAYNETNTWINDIVVLKVSPPIQMGDGVSPVVMVEQGEPAPEGGTHAVIAGWGSLQFPGPPANDLHKLEVQIVDHKKCEETYSPVPKKVIYSSQICVSGLVDGHDSTNGDSAAPLTVDGKVVGISSWVQIVGQVAWPSVYTNLAYYIDWINEHIKE